MSIYLSVFCGVVSIFGIIANILLLLICIRHRPVAPRTHNIFLLSFAAGNLLFLVTCLPLKLVQYSQLNYPFGVGVCKYTEFLTQFSFGLNAFNLIALAAASYFNLLKSSQKVVQDQSDERRAKRTQLATVAFIWILSGFCGIPAVIGGRLILVLRTVKCTYFVAPVYFEPEDVKAEILLQAFFLYIIPLIIIGIFYILIGRYLFGNKDRRTVVIPEEHRNIVYQQMHEAKLIAKIVLYIYLIFFVFYLPYYISLLAFSPQNLSLVVDTIAICFLCTYNAIVALDLFSISRKFRSYLGYLVCQKPPIDNTSATVSCREAVVPTNNAFA